MKSPLSALLLLCVVLVGLGSSEPDSSSHTNNWAVLVSSGNHSSQ